MRSLPRIVSNIPSDLRAFLDRVREYVSQDGDGRFVTLRELKSGGIVGTTPGGTITPPTDFNVENPTQPTGLATSGGIATVFLSWTAPNYHGHKLTEVWASTTNDITTAVIVGTSISTTFNHAVGSGETYYYWIRFVNTKDVYGAFNSDVGTVGTAGSDPAYLLDVLAGSITDAELSTALNTQIDTNTTQITNVRGLYTVKMDNQGYLTGFGLMSSLADGGVPTTDFFVNANRFAITTPTTSIPTRANSTAYAAGAFVGVASSTSKMLVCKVAGTSGTSAPNIASTAIGALVTDGTVTWQVASRVPLSVLTTSTTINGVSVSPGVYIDGAAIVNATITTATIGDAAITTAKIADTIQSTNYGASTGWQINKAGAATFNEVTVRGTIYGGAATAFGTGVGLFSGDVSGTYSWRLGNPSGARIEWNGSALSIYNSANQLTISSGDIDYSAIIGAKPPTTASSIAVYRQTTAPAAPATTSSVTTLTRSTTTATATTAAAHGLSVGSIITLSGVTNNSNWNAVYTVAQIISTTQFTFVVPSTLTTPATGTMVITPKQLSVNDLWFNTSTSATYYYDGSAWQLAGDKTSSNTAAAIAGQGSFATVNTITSSNISGLVGTNAIDSTYIASLAADKITTGTLRATSSITVGSASTGITISGANNNIIANLSGVEQVRFGNLGTTYGVRGQRSGTTVFQLDNSGLLVRPTKESLFAFGGSYNYYTLDEGLVTLVGPSQTVDIPINVYTAYTINIFCKVTGYYENDAITSSSANSKFMTIQLQYSNVNSRLESMGGVTIASDTTDASNFPVTKMSFVFTQSSESLYLRVQSRTSAVSASTTRYRYVIWTTQSDFLSQPSYG